MALAAPTTKQEIIERLNEVPDNARFFMYTGHDGTKLQAEWNGYEFPHAGDGTGRKVIASSSTCVPQAGGVAV